MQPMGEVTVTDALTSVTDTRNAPSVFMPSKANTKLYFILAKYLILYRYDERPYVTSGDDDEYY